MGTNTGTGVRAEGVTDTREAKNVTVVGIGPRLFARLIDTVLIFFISIIVAIVGGLIGEFLGMYSANVNRWGAIFTVVAGLVFSLIYYIGAWANSGQTLGDTLLSLKIVTTHGTPLGTGKAIVRYIGYLISAAVASIGFLWITFDGKRQGWHDKMAGTVVIPAQQYFSDDQRVTFVPGDLGGSALWVGLWVALAFLAPGALFAGLFSLGPFVDQAIKAIRGG